MLVFRVNQSQLSEYFRTDHVVDDLTFFDKFLYAVVLVSNSFLTLGSEDQFVLCCDVPTADANSGGSLGYLLVQAECETVLRDFVGQSRAA